MFLKDLYSRLWGPKFLTNTTIKTRISLYTDTIAFCFRDIGANDFTARLVKLNSELSSHHTNSELRHWVRDNILYNGYMMRNIKFYLFALATRPDRTVDECAQRFGVLHMDKCVNKMLTPQLRNTLIEARDKAIGINLYSLDAYNKLLESVWTDSTAWVARMCWRKLRFIANSTGVDVTDLQTEVMTEALRAVNHMWPHIPCELYAHNLFKRTAHNVAMNLIERSTSKKHARLVQTGEGWTQLNVDYEGLVNNPIDDAALCVDTRTVVDLKLDVDLLITKLPRKKRLFVQSLVGTQLDLCKWLFDKNLITENQDNEDYLKEHGLTKYLKAVSAWLEIKHQQARDFLNYIRSYFGVYCVSPIV